MARQAARAGGVAMLVLAGPLPAGGLHAQTWPVKPIRVIVPFAGGGPIDAVARPVLDKAGAALGQAMMFESRPGASGTIGSDLVARASKDGYTLLFTTGSHTSNAVYLRKLPYDPITDFLPVSQVARAFGQVLVVHPALPFIRAGKLRALALSGIRRSPVLPDVPTCQEVGLGAVDFTGWHATWLPAGAPVEIARQLQAQIAKRAGIQPE